MLSARDRKPITALGLGAALAGSALLLAACGSSGSSGSSAAAQSGGASSPPAATASTATVMTTSAGSLGDHLTNAAGRSLYMFASDTAKKSTCTGACASAWPPLLTHGSPKAGHGASAAKLGTITRPDGTHQVTYAGHPLYTFADDTAAGQTNGQGSNGFGAKWWVLAPSGTVITSAAPSGGSSSTTSGGGGYGY